nr:exopolyphosphatase [Algicola sagamiensis]
MIKKELLSRIERKDDTIAAVDLGSNSFHLILARVVNGTIQILHREKQKVQLALGLDERNILCESSMALGLETLKAFSTTLSNLPPSQVRVVGTYTLRAATNADAFLLRAKDVFPFPIEVISGQEEARLIYQGIAHHIHGDEKRLVIDIGGGSTELVLGQGFQTIAVSSLNMGCVSFTQAFFKNGQITKKRFEAAILEAGTKLEHIQQHFLSIGWEDCFGSSGTIKAICEAENTQRLTMSNLLNVKQQLISASHVDDLDIPGLNDDRKPVICAGLAILIAIFKQFEIDSINYSDVALREGVMYEMEERMRHHDIRQRTVESLIQHYHIDTSHAKRVLETTAQLFEQLKQAWQLDNPEFQSLLEWAAILHEVGLHINSSGVHRHSSYIIRNSNLPGFNQEEQLLLATLVRFYKKKIRPEEIPLFNIFDGVQVHRMICILRLAILLNQKRKDEILPEFQVQYSQQKLTLKMPQSWLESHPILREGLEQEKEQLNRMGIRLYLQGIH